MSRESIALTDDEVARFLSQRGVMALGTLGADGAPCGDIVRYTIHNGLVHFACMKGRQSARNIERDPRICCAVEQNPSYYEIKGVTIRGWARPVDDAGLCRTVLAALPPPPPQGADLAVYYLEPKRTISFDFSKIQNRIPTA